MTKLIALLLFFIFATFITILFSPAYAQCTSFLNCLSGIYPPGLQNKFPADAGLTVKVLSVFLPAIFSILGFITIIMIVISGIQFTTSQGNPEAAAAARGRLTYAIIGLILVIASYAILQLINRFFLNVPDLTNPV